MCYSVQDKCVLYATQFRTDKDSANVSGLTDDRLEKYSVGYFMTRYYVYLRPFRRLRKIPKSDYQLRHISVCRFVRMEQLGSHWMDFREI